MNICNDMLRIPLPRYLQKHGGAILTVFDNALGWDYEPKKWQATFKNDPAVRGDLSEIREKCPNMISRSDICYFAHQARSGDYPKLKRLFLASMIWGYGGDPNGPVNTKLALSDHRAEEVLKGTMTTISNSHIKEAYDRFDLAGCGPAFFTKFFYFVGKEWGAKPLPLILDSHVANFLLFLGEEEGWKLSLFAKVEPTGRVKRYPEGYVQYICSMDDWAKELGCRADNIEYFMYKKDKELEKALGEVNEEGNPKIPIIFHRDGAYCLKCGAFLASPEPGVGFTSIKIKGIAWRHACCDI